MGAPDGLRACAGPWVIREQVGRFETSCLKRGHDPLLIASGAANDEGAAVLSLLDVQARVVVVVGWADAPEAVVAFLVAIHGLKDLHYRFHALSFRAPPGRTTNTTWPYPKFSTVAAAPQAWRSR